MILTTFFLTASVLLCLTVLLFSRQSRKPLPEGISYLGEEHPASDIEFLADLTYVDKNGIRNVEQEIFDEIFGIIASARCFIVLDMFLYNPFQGSTPETTRPLSSELTQALVEHKRKFPALEITVITDPINTVYGGLRSEQFQLLRTTGIRVVTTKLEELRDSNPVYSFFWRFLVQPFGNGSGQALPNPFGAGRVSVRSYLSLLNFKTNHRKVLIADSGNTLVGLVTSANAHDGSSAHSNIAIKFNGAAVQDLLKTENSVLRLSAASALAIETPVEESSSDVTVQILTERQIKHVVLQAIADAKKGDTLRLAMFYLSDRHIISALESAHHRSVTTRVLLDPNRVDFGREKKGIPGRPVAHELKKQGIAVRWCDTHGEQFHMKMLLIEYQDGTSTLIAGSANFTRRSLENFNLETNVAVRGRSDAAVLSDAREFFELLWGNEPGRTFSTDYSVFADESLFKRAMYRFMEGSGMSTF